MNKFRKLGFVKYNGTLEVHNSLLNVVLRVIRGSHIDQPGVRYGTTKRVVIEPEVTMPVSVDGEVVGQTPAEFWVAPAALTVVAGEVRAG